MSGWDAMSFGNDIACDGPGTLDQITGLWRPENPAQAVHDVKHSFIAPQPAAIVIVATGTPVERPDGPSRGSDFLAHLPAGPS